MELITMLSLITLSLLWIQDYPDQITSATDNRLSQTTLDKIFFDIYPNRYRKDHPVFGNTLTYLKYLAKPCMCGKKQHT